MINVQIKPKDHAYPMLMQYIGDEDFVVYFENPHSGWVMDWGSTHHETMNSHYSNDWDIEDFEDFTGTLELRNV